jgi:hypothetical protein
MTLLQRFSKLFGCPILANGELHAVVKLRRERAEEKAKVAKQADDVIRDFVHGVNAETQRHIARRGH